MEICGRSATYFDIEGPGSRLGKAWGGAIKPRYAFSATVMALALLAGWFAPPGHSFEQRFVRMPPAMSWATFQAAKASAARPAFCPYAWFDRCRIS
jgi:hypothetical protein